MIRSARSRHRAAPAGLALALAFASSGCINVDLGAGGSREMRETVVLGDSGPKVLLLDIDGEITDSDAAGVLGWVLSEGTVARVRDELDLAGRNGDIAAILLRVDSPGGSPTASDAIYRQLVRFKQEHGVPIYAQFLSTAASGGYYVAMAADRIVASPTTVTGSIGVLMLGINLSGLMDKIGVENQTFTSGSFKDAGSFLRPMDDAERAQIQSVVDDLYERFLTVVEAGRPAIPGAELRRLADGRIYSAPQALEAGLVDAIAPLERTIDAVSKRLGADGVRVVSYHRKRAAPTNIYSRSTVHGAGRDRGRRTVAALAAPGLLLPVVARDPVGGPAWRATPADTPSCPARAAVRSRSSAPKAPGSTRPTAGASSTPRAARSSATSATVAARSPTPWRRRGRARATWCRSSPPRAACGSSIGCASAGCPTASTTSTSPAAGPSPSTRPCGSPGSTSSRRARPPAGR